MKVKFTKKQKWVLGVSLTILLIALGFIYNSPKALYLRGRLLAKLTKMPKVNGVSLVKLPAIYHRQEKTLSCEIAALKIALSAHEINVTETELESKLKFDPTLKVNGIWGDPYEGFVGDIDGRMGVTGYGVYWNPIAYVAEHYTRAEILEHASPETLAYHLAEGRSIVWWGYYGRGKKQYWQTPSGKVIQAILGEHARTIIGYYGSKDSPEGFIIMDPIYGEIYWETEKLLQNSAPFNNSGVVVYPKDSGIIEF
jgi:uncharacterized protein YvpB